MKPKSRSERFSDIKASVSDALTQAEELRDELQNWLDNMPENLRSGQKADDIESAVSELETFIDGLQTADGVDVEFPGMY